MRIGEILCEMTWQEAAGIYNGLGIDVSGMSADALKRARNTLIKKHHQDRGGDLSTAQYINAAYDVLKLGPGQMHTPSRGSGRGDGGERGTPPWAWAGHAGGMAPNGSIYRNDFTDMNFIKKTMWELSGQSKEEWTIQGYDGAFFRGMLTVYGSAAIFHQMAEAMITWQTKGGNPYSCRAVFVSPRRSKELLLLYADGKFYDQNPIRMEHDSFNLNPSNDQQFVRKLPELLDQLKAQNGG